VSAANTEASSLDPATRRAGQSTRQGEGRDGRDGPSSGAHVFGQACANAHIDHRLILPRHPQTNGMVERFNGRISELCQQTRFESAAELEQTLKDYLLAYNHFIPQRAIGHRSPIDALKS
jgi:transposase InsO family protein